LFGFTSGKISLFGFTSGKISLFGFSKQYSELGEKLRAGDAPSEAKVGALPEPTSPLV
jgi:hypothetical protein